MVMMEVSAPAFSTLPLIAACPFRQLPLRTGRIFLVTQQSLEHLRTELGW